MREELPPAIPNKSVLWGAGLLLLSILWGFGILRLDDQQLIPAGTQWGLAVGTALLTTLALAVFFRVRTRPAGMAPATRTNWLTTVPLLLAYCLISFGPLSVFSFMGLNALLASGPVQQLDLPVENQNAATGKPGDWYVVVPFEGQHPRVAVESNPIAARTLRLTLQRGGFGYWVIRNRQTSIFAPGS